jgi:hypothetical protein
LYPGDGDSWLEIGIFFYLGFEADIIKFSLFKTNRKNHEIDNWELYPTPAAARDFKVKGVKMVIHNDQEQEYA